jgi:hypothetical protein
MKLQTRASRGRSRLLKPLSGLLGMVITLASVVALSASPAAMADEEAKGCQGPAGRPTSNLVGAGITTSGEKSTYTFTSVDTGSTKGVPGLIEYCVFPGAENTLPDSVTVDETPKTGAEGFDASFFEDPACPEEGCFSFHRNKGNESNIPLDGTTRTMGTATWKAGAPPAAEQAIILHINDEAECNRLGENAETCWVLPGEPEEEIPPADALTATKDATPSLERTFSWDIEKEVDQTKVEIAEGGTATFEYTVTVTHDEGTDSGWAVAGEITVNNPNSGAVTGVDIEDSINDVNSSCTVENGSGATIPAESSEAFPYECTYSEPPSSESETNTATVSWGEQTVDGKLLAEGTAEATAPVDWSTTEPTIVDGSVEVTDTLGGTLGTVTWEDESPKKFTYSHEFEGDPAGTCTSHDNTATFTTNTTETTGSASQEVEVCVGADLKVGKTATPSFKRTFPWSISKNVDKTSVSQVGGNATFKYTIEVTKGAGVDSDWAVAGEITVENPNDWEAITVDVADEIDDANASCTVTGGDDAVIPAGESSKFSYSCTYSAAPESGSQTNTATVTWDKDAASTPNDSAKGTAPVNWAVSPALVDDCVEVTDTVDGVPTTLDDPLCESKTYQPKLTFPVPQSDCVTHNNTAAFKTKDTGTTGEASQSVKVCGPADTGALTMGFWQNKNGQGIIKGGSSTAGVCNSATWLRQYKPFQDLSATANCTDVASYVTKVIKAANASGASMNSMLKAQMLATALDVYFSDPALGGNKIGAPAPIGGVKIDLTQVCKNISTCSVFENTSSAFGGATSLTVSQILTYAASQSNVGGSSWYGNVKATQELAKDTFDAINNEVAFGA